MRVLYVSHKPIYPTIDGGCKAMQQFWKCLESLDYSIIHFCISTEKHPFQLNAYPEKIRINTPIHSVGIKAKPTVLGALKSLLSGKSYVLNRFKDNQVKDQMLDLIQKSKFDAIIFESVFSALFIDEIKKNTAAKLIIRTHNVEFNIWKDFSKNATFLKQKYLKKLTKDLKKEERQLLNKADLIFSISEQDTFDFKKLSVHTKIATIPVAIEGSSETFSPTKNKISFLGAMNWQPNIEAVNILVNSILPRLRKQIPDLELHIAGSFMEDSFKSNPKTGLVNHGFIENPNAFLAQNGIFVAPIQSGSGVKIKILEALSSGTPVITTSKGGEGIKTSKSLLIADDDLKMGLTIEKLLPSESEQLELSKNAKSFIEQNYSINSVSKLILSELEF